MYLSIDCIIRNLYCPLLQGPLMHSLAKWPALANEIMRAFFQAEVLGIIVRFNQYYFSFFP